MLPSGAVAEWLMAAVLKTAEAQAFVSSNLTRSAIRGNELGSGCRQAP
jgi:hypothetical protein